MLGLAMAKMTPDFYFPCRHCGEWRRNHAGKERKCLFQASCFEPKWPMEFTAKERESTLARMERLDKQLVNKMRTLADARETAISKIIEAARFGCTHVNDAGMGLLERYAPTATEKYHVVCSLCEEDWYEDEEGKKLYPAGIAGAGE